MKLFVPFLVLALFSTGCANMGSTAGGVDNGLISIVNNPGVLQVTAGLTTSLTLSNIKAADRKKVAQFVYAVAEGIRTTATSGKIDQSAIDVLAQKLLTGLPENYRLEVGVLVSTLQGLAIDRLNQAISAISVGDRTKAETYRQLVIAVAVGVENAAIRFTGGTPTVLRGAQPEDFGQIKVPALKW